MVVGVNVRCFEDSSLRAGYEMLKEVRCFRRLIVMKGQILLFNNSLKVSVRRIS